MEWPDLSPDPAPIAHLVVETVRAASKTEPNARKWIARAAHLCPSPY